MTVRVGMMDHRVTFQKASVEVDRYSNHKNVWTDHFTCSARVQTFEKREDGGVVGNYNDSISFRVRWCPELAEVDTTGWRVLFQGRTYEIEGIDWMNYAREAITFKCLYKEVWKL